MGSRVLTACSFRSKSIPQQVFHRCRSAEALRLFRVPVVYLTSAFLWFFSILLFRGINNLRRINPPEGFDSHPGHQCAFSNTETPERSPEKNAEAHLRSLPQKGFRRQHHRFSLQSLICYVRSFAAIACTARLSRLRPKRLPG